MKKVITLVLLLLPFCLQSNEIQGEAPPSSESANHACECSEGKLLVTSEMIYTISPFEQIAYLTAFSYAGSPVWELPFNTRVVSWEVQEGNMFVFSKNRVGTTFFLTCIDITQGQILWEKVILAPLHN